MALLSLSFLFSLFLKEGEVESSETLCRVHTPGKAPHARACTRTTDQGCAQFCFLTQKWCFPRLVVSSVGSLEQQGHPLRTG